MAELSTMVLKPPCGFRYDKMEDGWTLVEDTPVVGEPTLAVVGFFKKGEDHLSSKVVMERVRARMKRFGPLAGQHHAEALLRQQDQIPSGWRKYSLLFGGTVWHDPVGGHCIPTLVWEGQWIMDFLYYKSDFFRHEDWLALGEDRFVHLPQV